VFHKESRLFFDKLSNYQLFKDYPAPWSYVAGTILNRKLSGALCMNTETIVCFLATKVSLQAFPSFFQKFILVSITTGNFMTAVYQKEGLLP
jgi:hypothetical protein